MSLPAKYCLITPCRNEAEYARRTLDSVVAQTVAPALWVIVDDGSTDETPAILAEYEATYPFIRVVQRADRGFRKLGGGVIDAFYEGYATIEPSEFTHVCKLDLDLELPPHYFEHLIERMQDDPRVGTASGKPYFESAGKLVPERCGDENSVGMIKFYRTDCFDDIGGFVRELNWDGIDGHLCRMNGWKAVSWDDPEVRFLHLRPMGTSHKNWWTGRVRYRSALHGYGTDLSAGERRSPVVPPTGCRGQPCDDVGIFSGFPHSCAEISRPRIPTLSSPIPTPIALGRQGSRHTRTRRSTGAPSPQHTDLRRPIRPSPTRSGDAGGSARRTLGEPSANEIQYSACPSPRRFMWQSRPLV